MRIDVRIGELRVDPSTARPAEVATSVERELGRLLLGGRRAGAGPGAVVARAVHAELRKQSVPGVPR